MGEFLDRSEIDMTASGSEHFFSSIIAIDIRYVLIYVHLHRASSHPIKFTKKYLILVKICGFCHLF